MEKWYDKIGKTYSKIKKDYYLTKVAKDYEHRAERHEKGKWKGSTPRGRIHALSPYNIGNEYSVAARNWVKAGEIKKAYQDYVKASKLYLKQAESRKDYMISQGFKDDDNNYGKMHQNCIKAGEEAQRQAERLKNVLGGNWKGLEGMVGKIAASVLTIGFFSASIFFINPRLSGMVVSGLNPLASNSIGVALLIAGLFTALFVFKKH